MRTPRFFTQRECCRLQGFPETFRIPAQREGDEGRFYYQIGNAVAPPMIALVALPIAIHLASTRPARARAAGLSPGSGSGAGAGALQTVVGEMVAAASRPPDS